ncbi:tetratricopeptide repeat protein [Hyphococcus luteus]|uniref:Uncharacterized protein n=1 Tax=Hyphococcus luteus TaxID=2058213 RepID=A0A2S7K2N3_9PROT|nr:tetratricopeptide repeat protein [Marinicaulis flavus]PQA86756.1 hypothetical protein CW354_14800 [Marinicaulis flavus]
MRILTCLTCVVLACAAPAAAQMSVTTIGATDAANCYENARSDFSRSTEPCDKALKDAGLSISDRKKTLVNRGVIHNRNGDLGAALEDFNEAIEMDAALGEAYLNRGNSYYLAQRFDDAMADYERALDIGVGKPWAAWYNIGLVYEAKKQPDKAREAYEEALSANPDFTQAQQKLEG